MATKLTLAQRILHNKFSLELVVATALFIAAAITGMIIEFIIYILYYIIFIEIVRAVTSFIREQRIKVGLLIDASIVLAIREFIVNVVKINKENFDSFEALFASSVNFHILVFSGVLVFLFTIRFLANKTVPDLSKDEQKEF